MSATPTRYVPTDRQYTDKSWLYEQYWAELRSIEEIATLSSVSASTISRQLHRHGIPVRSRHMPVEDHGEVSTALRSAYQTYNTEMVEAQTESVRWTR